MSLDWKLLKRAPRLASWERLGARIQFKHNQHIQGIGEAWPLPGWSEESLDEITTLLASLSKARSRQAWAALSESSLLPPSLQWAFSSALTPCSSEPIVRKTAILLAGTLEAIQQRIVETTPLRYPIAKVKLNTLNLSQTLLLIKTLLERWPWVRLRLDFNRHWRMNHLEQLLVTIPLERLDYVEDPPMDAADWKRLFPSIPLALDELLRVALKRRLPVPDADAWILKPTLLGSLSYVKHLCREGQTRGCRIIFSSCFEGFETLQRHAHLSSPEEIHGWDPYAWHQQEVSLPIQNGGFLFL